MNYHTYLTFFTCYCIIGTIISKNLGPLFCISKPKSNKCLYILIYEPSIFKYTSTFQTYVNLFKHSSIKIYCNQMIHGALVLIPLILKNMLASFKNCLVFLGNCSVSLLKYCNLNDHDCHFVLFLGRTQQLKKVCIKTCLFWNITVWGWYNYVDAWYKHYLQVFQVYNLQVYKYIYKYTFFIISCLELRKKSWLSCNRCHLKNWRHFWLVKNEHATSSCYFQ